jgi:hypothetical protein
MSDSNITSVWRGSFTNDEIHALHAEAFETRLYDESEWDWIAQCERYSLGGSSPVTATSSLAS